MATTSNYYTQFYYDFSNTDANKSLVPNQSVMGLGSAWTLRDWNSTFNLYEGSIPADFRNYTYIENNFDSWSGLFGGDKNILLSQYSDLVLLGSGDDQIVVKNDVWTPWGGDDVILGGSGTDKIIFMTGTQSDYTFTKYNDVYATYGDVDLYGTWVEVASNTGTGTIKTYSVEGACHKFCVRGVT